MRQHHERGLFVARISAVPAGQVRRSGCAFAGRVVVGPEHSEPGGGGDSQTAVATQNQGRVAEALTDETLKS